VKEVSIVTDSTTDIPQDMAKAYDIAIVPLMVNFGDDTYPDGFLTQEEFFARMNAAPKLPTTSQPSVRSPERSNPRLRQPASSASGSASSTR
jgi:fatty acid-binding protein DegV